MKRPCSTALPLALVLPALGLLALLSLGALAAPAAIVWTIQGAIDATPNGGTVFVPPGVYTESLTLSRPVSLTGSSPETTIVHAVAGQRVLTATGAAINTSVVISGLTFAGGEACSGVDFVDFEGGGLLIADGASPLVSNVVIRDCQAEEGGGMYSSMPLALVDVVFLANTANLYGGGGLYSAAPITLTRVSFISNTSYGDWEAGGGLFASGDVTLGDCLFQANSSAGSRGGGLQAAASASVAGSRFISNTADLGGGLNVWGHLDMIASTLSGNAALGSYGAGGGALVHQGATIAGCHFEGNQATSSEGSGYGGGLAVYGALILTDTYFIGNTADAGGAVRHAASWDGSGAGHITNVLFARNRAEHYAAALCLESDDPTTIVHATITDDPLNPHEAIWVWPEAPVAISNTIIAHHTFGIMGWRGSVVENHNLFFGNRHDRLDTGLKPGPDSTVGDPRFLDPEDDDYRLGPRSAARNGGIDLGILADLDGNPRLNCYRPDMGAYEYQGDCDACFLPVALRP